MELLRKYLSEAGFSDVANILAEQIGKVILLKFGFAVKVILRQRTDIEKVLLRNPFFELEHKQTYIVFSEAVVNPVKIDDFNQERFHPDLMVIDGDIVYIHYGTSAGTSKLTLQVLEKQLGIVGTMRNLNTTNKLLELLLLPENK
jgi:uncharacterized protein (DUF1697 family)